MEFTAIEIASILDGQIKGDEGVKVSKLSKIEEGESGSISFLSNPKYTEYIYSTKSSIVIVNNSFIPTKKVDTTLIFVPDAYQAFTKLLHYYSQNKNNKDFIEESVNIHSTVTYGNKLYVGSFTYIDENVKIGENVKLYPNSYIGANVTIGNNTIIFAGVKIYDNSIIGNNCIIHSGTVIGSDGFGFAPTKSGALEKIPQIGNVIIEDDVEIGSSCTIDRATMGSTIIRKGVKLDNQIQIAHNVEVGENTVIASQSGVAGSTKIGKNCMIGGQVGIAGHLKIGDFVQIQAQSGINSNVPNGAKLYGSPAIDASAYRKSYVYFRKFPSIINRLEKLENKLTNKK